VLGEYNQQDQGQVEDLRDRGDDNEDNNEINAETASNAIINETEEELNME
jgi:hypothetical protein